MLSNSDHQVAVLIDYENIEISLNDKMGRDADVNWERVLGAAVELGRVVIRRAYADWVSFSSNQRELMRLGVDLVHVTSKRGKNACDIRIVIDAMELIADERSNISHVMLVSGDGDFTDLVHKLRRHGKVVVGVGISGASAEYLINACDQFIFYDVLVGGPAKPHSGKPAKAPVVQFDISEARQLLRRAFEASMGEWISGGQVKNAMLRLNPAFSERNYYYDNFKDFLIAQSDLVRVRTAQGGHLEVQFIPDVESPPGLSAPEALLDRYLDILEANRILMTPNEHRPAIIIKFYEIYQAQAAEAMQAAQPGHSLTEIKERLHEFYEQTAPQVKWQSVHDVVHQLFRSYCFKFDQDEGKGAGEVRLWDRIVHMEDDIHSPTDLLDKCDRGLLQKVMRGLEAHERLDAEAAGRLLYGSLRGPKMLNHIRQLIAKLDENGAASAAGKGQIQAVTGGK